MKFSLEEKKAICALFDKCDVAMLKISIHDGVKHIDKVYLDGKYYDIPSEDLGIKISFVNGAVDLIREKGNISKLDKDERNFVIRNHPAWIMLRDCFDLNGELDHSLCGVVRTNQKKPYEVWSQDFCDSVGDKKYYPKKNMKSLLVTYSEFARIHNSDSERVRFPIKRDLATSFPKGVKALYRGFFEAIRIMALDDDNFKLELNKFGYPEVYYNQGNQWIKIDVGTDEGLEKLSSLSKSPYEKIKPVKETKVKKKRPTKGKKKK